MALQQVPRRDYKEEWILPRALQGLPLRGREEGKLDTGVLKLKN